jgi:sugar/nucleoside kinase (ribokinase family)
VADAALELLGRGCGAVVVTLGSRGALVVAAGDAAADDAVLVPAVAVPPAEVVDTTGAGDAFSGALAFFYLQLLAARGEQQQEGDGGGQGQQGQGQRRVSKGLLVQAARRAAWVSAASVRRKGTQASYPAVAVAGEVPAALFDAGPASDGWEGLPVPRPALAAPALGRDE